MKLAGYKTQPNQRIEALLSTAFGASSMCLAIVSTQDSTCMGTNSMPCAFATSVMLSGMPAPQLYHHGSAESRRRSCGSLDCPPKPRFGPADHAQVCKLSVSSMTTMIITQ